jgi:hypothetical protein
MTTPSTNPAPSQPNQQTLQGKIMTAIGQLSKIHEDLNQQQANRAALAYPGSADVTDLQKRKERIEKAVDDLLDQLMR